MSPLARDVYLWGPMGTGKSTVGAALARATGATFVDTDDAVQQRTGRTIPELFASGGEGSFRRAERDVLEHLLASAASGRPRVVSLGGGALLDRALRLQVLERATLFTLAATPERCAARIDVSRETRPLLAGRGEAEAVETLRRLTAERSDAYAETHLTVDTTTLGVDEVVARLQPLLGRTFVAVAAGRKTYPVVLGTSTEALRAFLPVPGATSTQVVTDANVGALAGFASLLEDPGTTPPLSAPVVLTPGERYKTLAGLEPIWDTLLANGADRSAALVGIGGGVVTDMTGFAASAWHRGIRWVAAPTTLLGMVDASVGGKTGVDRGPAKNALGAFHPPVAVHASIAWLETEPDRSYRSGLVELLKTALIARPDVVSTLLAEPASFGRRDPQRLHHAVTAATSTKAAIVSRDPEENGERAVLNLGHTLGHALESAGGYDRLTHGEAVGLGLLAAIRVGAALGITEDGRALASHLASLLRTWGLPHRIDDALLASALPLLGLDKKKKGRDVRFIVLERPGRARMIDLPLDELRKLLSAHAKGLPGEPSTDA